MTDKFEAAFYNDAANAFYEQGRFAEAVELYDKTLEIEPKNAQTWFNKANALAALQRFDEAKHAYKQAILYNPAYVEAYNNLGIMLQGEGCFAEAEEAYKQAIELCDEYINAYCNYGVLLKELRRFEEAEAMYKTVLSLEPSDFETLCNLALLKLAQGNFDEGWLLYESRYSSYKKIKVVEKPKLPLPQWRGEDIRGKTILALPEQGYGDEIQFVRFVSTLKEMGAKVVLQCRRELKGLFASLDSVDLLIVDGDDAKDVICDFWVFLMSAPGLLHVKECDFASHVPYLFAPPTKKEEWAHKMNSDTFKVGLVYKGSCVHVNDKNRSIHSVELLSPLFEVKGAIFFSLQKEYEIDNEATLSVVSLGADIIDFSDTAAIIENLDLLICVDTAAAHIAGAMGKKCWVLLPYSGMDWRWALYEERTPWYPSLRLFKQARNESWESVLERVLSALQLELGQAKIPTLSQAIQQ